MVSEYNNIRSRLYNSQALLDGTNLMLYRINEAVLVSFASIYNLSIYLYVFAFIRYGGTRMLPGGKKLQC